MKQMICTEFDALAHCRCIHTNETHWQCIFCEFGLNFHSFFCNIECCEGWCQTQQKSLELASKVTVKSLIMARELIREGQPWWNASLFEPKYCAETRREEYSLDCCKSNEMHGKRVLVRITPIECPLCFVHCCGDGICCMEQLLLLAFFSNETRVCQQSMHFSMDIFHCSLEGTETACFWHLHFTGKIGNKIFHCCSI